MHDGENALLHLTSVLGSKDNHFMAFKVDRNARGTGHTGRVTVLMSYVNRMEKEWRVQQEIDRHYTRIIRQRMKLFT